MFVAAGQNELSRKPTNTLQIVQMVEKSTRQQGYLFHRIWFSYSHADSHSLLASNGLKSIVVSRLPKVTVGVVNRYRKGKTLYHLLSILLRD